MTTTIYLASHETGKLSMFYYGFWCFIHRVHLLHRKGTPLPYFIGSLSIETRKNGGTFDMIRELLASGQVKSLLMFGKKISSTRQHFGNGIFTLAKDLGYEVRHLMMNSQSLTFKISDPINPITQEQYIKTLNESWNNHIQYSSVDDDVQVDVINKDLYRAQDALVIIMGLLVVILVGIILLVVMKKYFHEEN